MLISSCGRKHASDIPSLSVFQFVQIYGVIFQYSCDCCELSFASYYREGSIIIQAVGTHSIATILSCVYFGLLKVDAHELSILKKLVYTGCKNAFNCNHPVARQFMADMKKAKWTN